VRENIVRYTDEGGEEDIKAYDMTSLRIQITGNNCVDSFNKTDNYRTRIARKLYLLVSYQNISHN
jgi:hypothetical protein